MSAWQLLRRLAPHSVLALALLTVWASLYCDPRKYKISLGNEFHISLLYGHVVFFNDPKYGPYHGSIVGFAGNEYPKATGYGYAWGIYYRHFVWPEYKLWTLAVTLLYFVGLGICISVTALVRSRFRRKSKILTQAPDDADSVVNGPNSHR